MTTKEKTAVVAKGAANARAAACPAPKSVADRDRLQKDNGKFLIVVEEPTVPDIEDLPGAAVKSGVDGLVPSRVDDSSARKDVKEGTPGPPRGVVLKVKGPRHRAMSESRVKMFGKAKYNLWRTKLAWSAAVGGSAGATLATVINVEPDTATEWAEIITLFDECKVLGGTFHFRYAPVTTTTATPIESIAAAAYDPVDATAYAAIPQICLASQHIGPLAVSGDGFGNVGYGPGPTSVTRTGFWSFRFKVPPGPQEATSDNVKTGEWASTASADIVWGYIKTFCQSQSNVTQQLNYVIVLDMEFRSRS